MADDPFEAAREAFFGTERRSSTRRASPTEPPKPQDRPSENKELPTEDNISPTASAYAMRGLAQECDAQWEWLLCLASTFRALRNNGDSL